MPKQIAIIGAGLAGAKVAEALRRDGYDGRLWLIGEEAIPPYQRPPLSKDCLLENGAPFGSVVIHDEDYYRALNIDLILGNRVDGIDPARRTVSLRSGRLDDIDKIVICTGGRPRHFGVGEDILYLRNIEDAQAIGAQLRADAQVVILGGGLIGCEVAAAARKRGASVTIIEAGPTIMWRSLGRTVAQQMERFHRAQGVSLKTNMTVIAHEREGMRHLLLLANGERIEADVVVAGLGLVPHVQLAEAAGISVSDGILVDAQLRTIMPDVLAAGDVANFPSAFLGRRVRLETIHNANAHGERAAATLLGREAPSEDVPWGWSDQFDMNLQMAGDINPHVSPVFRGDPESNSFCALFYDAGVLRGAVGCNRPGEMAVFRRLVNQGCTTSADILCDETVAARTLLNRGSQESACSTSPVGQQGRT